VHVRRARGPTQKEWWHNSRITAERVTIENGPELRVNWSANEEGYTPPPTWTREGWVPELLLRAWRALRQAVEQRTLGPLTVDLNPIISLVRGRGSSSVMIAKNKSRPRRHEIDIPELAVEPMALAFLNVCRCPWLLDSRDPQIGMTSTPLPIVTDD